MLKLVEAYIEDLRKLALALTSAQMAKAVFVSEDGVGEDIAFNFFFWKDHKVALIMQLNKDLMKLGHRERFVICADLCLTVRQYWGIDAITMIAEGYCSQDPEKTKGLELDKEFPKKESGVMECITLTHAEYGVGQEPNVQVMACPYDYQPGRIVDFKEPIYYSEGVGNILRDKKYPAMLVRALNNEIMHHSNDQLKDELLDNFHERGVFSQDFGL